MEGERVVAVACYRPDGARDWVIDLIGVDLDYQGNRYGSLLIEALIYELAQRSPGGVVSWLVQHENLDCLTMSGSHLKAGVVTVDAPVLGHVTYALKIDPSVTL